LIEENKLLKARPSSTGKVEEHAKVVGVIDQGSITAYQHAVDELLLAARSDTPTNVLVAMKSIVITCKNITEDTENFEVFSPVRLNFRRVLIMIWMTKQLTLFPM
jgi:hypothetical protein